MNLADVLDEFRKRPWQKKLLILDIGQISTDRDLGVFANDFSNRLKQELDKRAPENFTVLCSCAPGQTSWSSDADRRSVFAHYVADGMGRARDVQELVAYVKKRVYQWVKTHRGATQTPISWGSPASSFLLPKPPVESGIFSIWGVGRQEAADSPVARRWMLHNLWTRLAACYQSRDGFADQRPYRYAPLAWREYQETLLRAERLYRAGLFPECADVMRRVDGLEQELKNPFTALPEIGYPSLEMGLSIAANSGFRPQWASDREWQRALDWPLTPNAPDLPEKPKAGNAAKKQGGGIVSAEIAEKAGAPEKWKPILPEVLGMIAEGKNPWGTFVEGQLIDWGIEWTKSHPNPIFFSERERSEVFLQALRVRRIAERAASASWQPGPWFDAQLQAGDAARRQAQDDLFAGDQDSDAVSRHLKEAEVAYERTIKYGKALELLTEIRAEWPFLGAWKVRRAATAGARDVFRNADFIVNFASRVAKLDARLDPWGPRESRTDASNADFEREYEAVRQDFEQVKGEFKIGPRRSVHHEYPSAKSMIKYRSADDTVDAAQATGRNGRGTLARTWTEAQAQGNSSCRQQIRSEASRRQIRSEARRRQISSKAARARR